MIDMPPDLVPSSLLNYEQVSPVAQMLIDKSHTYQQMGEWEQAKHCALDAREFCRETGAHVGRAVAQIHLSDLYYETGNQEQALEQCEEAYHILERQPARVQRHNEAVAAYALGILHEPQFSGDGMKALRWYEKALQLLPVVQEHWGSCNNIPQYDVSRQMIQCIKHRGKQIAENGGVRPVVGRAPRRLTTVRFPEQCLINQTVCLSVQLTLEPVQVRFDPPTRESEGRRVELIVFVSANGFEITDRRWQEMSMPFDQESERIEFEMVGLELGQQTVEIEIFHRTDRVGYVVVATQVVGGATSGQDDKVTLEADYDRVWSDPPERADVVLRVDLQEDKKSIKYDVIKDGGWRPLVVPCGSLPFTQDRGPVTDFWEEMVNLLEVVKFSGRSESQLNSIQFRVEGLGRSLCEKFLTPELQRRSVKWRKDSVVVIDTEEQCIPWELIHDGDDFWGNKFILARLPRKPQQSPLPESDREIRRYASTPLQKAVHIIGGINGESIESISRPFTARRWNILIKPMLDEVLQSIADADLIHFTCHGRTTPRPCLQLADDRPLTPSLIPSDLNRLTDRLTGSLVFANACASAATARFLGELCNFGWEFYTKGTIVYIGTLGLMPIDYAVRFAERFYESLYNGYSAGESLRYAKTKSEQGNPFRLLYALYGYPFARKLIQP